MIKYIYELLPLLKVGRRQLAIYIIIYFSWGLFMQHLGEWTGIARFTYWWRVITCYLLYMIPISLLLRNMPWHSQYAYGVVAMGVLEFMGYWLGTSLAFENNLLDQVFGIRNFSLGMALFFGAYFPLGNKIVAWIDRQFINKFRSIT